MSAWDQKVKKVQSEQQDLTVTADPYESVAFKIQDWQVDTGELRFYTHGDPES
jgi:hypothetical protein